MSLPDAIIYLPAVHSAQLGIITSFESLSKLSHSDKSHLWHLHARIANTKCRMLWWLGWHPRPQIRQRLWAENRKIFFYKKLAGPVKTFSLVTCHTRRHWHQCVVTCLHVRPLIPASFLQLCYQRTQIHFVVFQEIIVICVSRALWLKLNGYMHSVTQKYQLHS